MPSFNKAILMGNLTRDPELRYTQSGSPVCSFGVAINERYKTKNGDAKEEVCFIDITVWGSAGENCNKYLSKGSACLVEGKIKLDTWEHEGQKRSKHGIVANSVQFLDGKKDDNEGRQERRPEPQSSQQSDEPPFPNDNEIPF